MSGGGGGCGVPDGPRRPLPREDRDVAGDRAGVASRVEPGEAVRDEAETYDEAELLEIALGTARLAPDGEAGETLLVGTSLSDFPRRACICIAL